MKFDYSFVNPYILEETIRESSSSKMIGCALGTHRYPNATIVPSSRFIDCGVLDCCGNSIYNGGLHELCQTRSVASEEEVIHSSDTVIYIGILHNVWGHCLTDALKKLWYLHTDECQLLKMHGAKVVYLLPDNDDLRPYAVHLYNIVGIDIDSLIPISRPTQFKEVIIPDNSIVCSKSDSNQWKFLYSAEYESIISSMIRTLEKNENRDFQTFEKVYFTRTNINTKGREYGEKTLERVFRRLGFEIVAPEKYSLEEQFFILSHCNELAVTEGSISHSAIFCRPKTKLILLRKSFYVNGYQSIINEIRDLDVTYIDAHCSRPDLQYGAMYGPFYMCITPELERFVGHKIFHLPLWMRPSWWWYCNRNRKIVHLLFRLFGKE